jgi:hypothetical protein
LPESCKAAALQAARLAVAEARGQLLRSEGQKLSRKWNRQTKNTKGKKETQHPNRGKQIPISRNINSEQETALIRVLLPQRTAQVRLIILTTIDNRNRAETSGCNSPRLNLQNERQEPNHTERLASACMQPVKEARRDPLAKSKQRQKNRWRFFCRESFRPNNRSTI